MSIYFGIDFLILFNQTYQHVITKLAYYMHSYMAVYKT